MTIGCTLRVGRKRRHIVLPGRRPLWESNDPAASRLILTESTIREPELKSVRSHRYKYILGIGQEDVKTRGRAVIPGSPQSVELCDLESDPGELDNLLRAEPMTVKGAYVGQHARRLDRALRSRVAALKGQARTVEDGGENLEGLRALGYVE